MARTPQQNGVIERKNRTIQEMSRDIMDEADISHIFQGEATKETMYLSNITQLMPNSDKTPYELWKGGDASVKHYKAFGRKCFIKRNDKNIRRFDSHTDECMVLRYFN